MMMKKMIIKFLLSYLDKTKLFIQIYHKEKVLNKLNIAYEFIENEKSLR
jgi:hypothetical protein